MYVHKSCAGFLAALEPKHACAGDLSLWLCRSQVHYTHVHNMLTKQRPGYRLLQRGYLSLAVTWCLTEDRHTSCGGLFFRHMPAAGQQIYKP